MSTTLLVLAAIAVRNPFWPIGYEGVHEEISAEPKVEVSGGIGIEGDETATAGASAAAAAALAKNAKVISGRHWGEARKTLRISGSTIVTNPNGTKRHGVIINGSTYGNGDLVSVNHDGHRFTWKIQGLTDGATLKLIRVRAKELEEDDSKGED